jgi:hypothetical protein
MTLGNKLAVCDPAVSDRLCRIPAVGTLRFFANACCVVARTMRQVRGAVNGPGMNFMRVICGQISHSLAAIYNSG